MNQELETLLVHLDYLPASTLDAILSVLNETESEKVTGREMADRLPPAG